MRNCWPNVIARGLRENPGFCAAEGELVSLRFNALEKLHFLDGVFATGGSDSGAEAVLVYPEEEG